MTETPAALHPVLVCTAWPYVNGSLHVGHLAGVYVPADIFARYQRLKGNHVLMVSGTDEHGTPITLAADKEGVTPKELADRYNRVIGDDLRNLGLSYDTFTRTTTLNHYRVTQDLFKTLYEKGYILKPTPLAEYAGRDDKRIYVWFDAVIGYLSASVEWAKNRGTPDAWREWWQNGQSRHYYFMGKDNIVFHSVIWPSMLMGYGNGGEIGGGGDKPDLNFPYD